MRTAAKAMIELLGWTDSKRGGFFVMERATGLELVAGFFQLDTGIDDVDDVGTIQ